MNYFLIEHPELLRSRDCGMALLNPGWCHMQRRLEKESVIILGQKNSTLLDDEGTVIEIKKDRVVLLSAGRFHKGIKKIKDNVSYYWMHFTFSTDDKDNTYYNPILMNEKECLDILSNPTIAYNKLKGGIILPQYIDLKDSQDYYALFNRILQEKYNPGFSTAICNNLIITFLIMLSRESYCISDTQISKGQSLVNRTLILLDKNLSDPNLSLKSLGNMLEVNTDYLGRCFKKTMNTSIGQYIIKKRIDLACQRLRDTEEKIETIYTECGFTSKRQFYDDFKKLTKKTPAQYRAGSNFIYTNIL